MIESQLSKLSTVFADADTIARAVALLNDGMLVAMPTETVYGLAADATNKQAISRLYATKGRPSSHPVIVHLSSIESVSDWAIDVPDIFYSLAKEFWPGPLTCVLKRASDVLDEVTGGQDTVALRIPAHPVALQLLQAFGRGLAAPSANKFGHVSPTTAAHVRREFSESEVGLIIDGGPSVVGIESTIVDLTGRLPKILRPGMISELQIKTLLVDGCTTAERESSAKQVRVPGSLPSHYAPRTPLDLVRSNELATCLRDAERQSREVGVVAFAAPLTDTRYQAWRTMSSNAEDYARDLYKTLRELDDLRLDLILVESPPENDSQWTGIFDRLTRAAHR